MRLDPWVAYIAALCSPLLLFLFMGITAPLLSPDDSAVYEAFVAVLLLGYLATVAWFVILRRWGEAVILVVVLPVEAYGIVIAMLFGACLFFHECI